MTSLGTLYSGQEEISNSKTEISIVNATWHYWSCGWYSHFHKRAAYTIIFLFKKL